MGLPFPKQAINGFVHHIDSLLYLPDAVSDLLRSDLDLQMFQAGLIDTDIAVTINDTQSHLTQTIFAPTNEAFKRLGAKANKFLFSPLGKTYLTALLQYHVIMNCTLFTDVYFKPNNSGQVNMNTSSEAVRRDDYPALQTFTDRLVRSGPTAHFVTAPQLDCFDCQKSSPADDTD